MSQQSIQINKNLMSINHTASKRTKDKIKFIVVHYVGALGDAKANTDYYKSANINASADFWVGHTGDIWQGNDYWNYYSWHCGGGLQGDGGHSFYGICTNANSVGIEMCVKKKSTATKNATDKDWYFENATIETTVKLVAYLMEELDIDIDHVIRHYDVTGKICPNPFVYNTGAVTWNDFKAKVAALAGVDFVASAPASSDRYFVATGYTNGKYENQHNTFNVLANAKNDAEAAKAQFKKTYYIYDTQDNNKIIYTAAYGSTTTPTTPTTTKGTQSSSLAGLSDSAAAAKLLEIAKPIALKYDLFPSVLAAQCCLESGFGHTTELSKSNNINGMKCNLVNSEWSGSVWDGTSKVLIHTPEYYGGVLTYIDDWFRAYPCIEDSMADMCAFFTTMKKYVDGGVQRAKNYREEITIISQKGYATDPAYITKVCSLIEKYGLDKYDSEKKTYVAPITTTEPVKVAYYVRKTWADSKTQLGAFSVLDNAKKLVDANKGYCVFDATGKQIYPAPAVTPTPAPAPVPTSDRYVVASGYSNSTYTDKHNTFNVLDNAKKDAETAALTLKKNFYVYDIQANNQIVYTVQYKSSADTIQTKMISMAHQFQQILEQDHKAGKYFTYQNKGYKQTIDESRSSGSRTTNCVILVNWVLKKLGLTTTGLLNHKYDGTIGYTLSKNCKTEIPKNFEFIKMSGTLSTLIKQNKLYPGDIVFFSDHMQMYLDASTALDGGRGNVKGTCVGGRFNYFVGKNPSLSKKVGLVCRSKGAVSNPGGAITTSSTPVSTAPTTPAPTTTPAATPKKLYNVKITADVLNVRKEPSTSSAIVTTVKKNTIFGITEEKNGFGRLLSGAGWISLTYTQKV